MVQTISYLPHFLSWVVVASLIRPLVASSGPLNLLAAALGLETPILFLQRPGTFLAIVLVSDIWKGVGWGSIIYLAAISGIDPSLYESAEISKIMGRRNGWLTEFARGRGSDHLRHQLQAGRTARRSGTSYAAPQRARHPRLRARLPSAALGSPPCRITPGCLRAIPGRRE